MSTVSCWPTITYWHGQLSPIDHVTKSLVDNVTRLPIN